LIKFSVLFSYYLNNKLFLYLLSNKVGNRNGPERVWSGQRQAGTVAASEAGHQNHFYNGFYGKIAAKSFLQRFLP
jgi:hypothetical protein